MSNIFNFRSKKTETLNSDFLKDADDTVEFDLIGREVNTGDLSLHFLREDLPDPVLRDWSNQELANIYRVKKLLDAAGVPNALERGITDEGDPWCIFCTHGGEVFIHLCRVDNRYTLDSPNLRNPITGHDFADLIAQFSDGALAKDPTAGARNRVIKLQRNGKVFLHPSALLAALIWSIYINSEDLVMLAPDDDAAVGLGGDDSITLLNEAALAPLEAGEETAVAQFMDTPLSADQIISIRQSEAALRTEEERDGTMFRDFMGKSAMVASAAPIAVGLSSIAIAFGIMSENFFDAGAGTDLAALDMPVTENSAETTVAEQVSADASRNVQFDLAAVLQAVFEHAPSPDVAPSALTTEIAADIDLSTLLSSILALPGPADVALSIAGGFQDSWVDEAPTSAPYGDEATPEQKTANADSKSDETQTTRSNVTDTLIESADSGLTTNPDAAFDLASVLDFTTAMTDAFKTFEFAGVQIQATFDIAAIAPVSSDPASPTPSTEPLITDLLNTLTDPVDTIDVGELANDTPEQIYDPLDVNARAFIQHLMNMSRTGDVEVIQTQSELILLDSEAILGAAGETMQMGWTLADGNTVYTIGMRTDYVEYDLIA